MEEKQRHSLAVYGRKQLVMEGVIQVDSFDETEIVLETNMGTLILKGAGLHITQLSKDTGGLTAEGPLTPFNMRKERQKVWAKAY
ncbi:MAG: YabP/YqfC family sporulation protein [Candidatus Syntrophopropionicum ammoniitolerans]